MARVSSKRKKSSHGIGKSGDRFNLSARSDERANKYLSDVDTRLPEKMMFHSRCSLDNRDNDLSNNMSTIENSLSSNKDSRPKSLGVFEFDTGWIELGYEKNKGNAVGRKAASQDKKSPDTKKNKESKNVNVIVSVQSNYSDGDSRKASELKSREIRTGNGEKIKSNDESFQTGVMYHKAEASSKPRYLRRQWEIASEKNGNESTYDDVAPFHKFDREKAKIQNLRMQARKSKTERTEIQKAITGVNTYQNKKESMKRNFDKQFDREIEKLRLNFKSHDDYWLFLKKKLQKEQGLEDDGVNIDFNKTEEESILDDVINAANQVFSSFIQDENEKLKEKNLKSKKNSAKVTTKTKRKSKVPKGSTNDSKD